MEHLAAASLDARDRGELRLGDLVDRIVRAEDHRGKNGAVDRGMCLLDYTDRPAHGIQIRDVSLNVEQPLSFELPHGRAHRR